MPVSKPPYPAEFRKQMVELYGAGRAPGELEREFGYSAQSVANWVARTAAGRGKPLRGKDVLMSAEREELSRLRRENRQLKLERAVRYSFLAPALVAGTRFRMFIRDGTAAPWKRRKSSDREHESQNHEK